MLARLSWQLAGILCGVAIALNAANVVGFFERSPLTSQALNSRETLLGCTPPAPEENRGEERSDPVSP